MSAETIRQQLDELGYALIPNVMDDRLLADLGHQVEQLFAREGELAGSEFKQEPGARRLANLVNKGVIFRHLLLHPLVFPWVAHVLDQDVKLSSLNARSADPHGAGPQPLHCDMGALPDERGAWVCNTVWLLDDFTSDNGALRVVPGSHRWRRLPQDELVDPVADHPQQVLITGTAGSAIVMNAHLWHGGMVNRTDRPRLAVHVFYCRRDKPQQQYQRQLLSSEVQQSLTPELRELLALDDALNDELCRQDVTRSGFLR